MHGKLFLSHFFQFHRIRISHPSFVGHLSLESLFEIFKGQFTKMTTSTVTGVIFTAGCRSKEIFKKEMLTGGRSVADWQDNGCRLLPLVLVHSLPPPPPLHRASALVSAAEQLWLRKLSPHMLPISLSHWQKQTLTTKTGDIWSCKWPQCKECFSHLLLTSFQAFQKFEQLPDTKLRLPVQRLQRDARKWSWVLRFVTIANWSGGGILLRDNWPPWCRALMELLCQNRDQPSGRTRAGVIMWRQKRFWKFVQGRSNNGIFQLTSNCWC